MNRTCDSVPGDLAELPSTSAKTTRPRRNGPAGDAIEDCPPYLRDLNFAQRAAARYGAPDIGPLLVVAGAGTGKTNTLAHRVAHLILTGTLPERILLLTFTRRAASEMTRRAERILAAARTVSKARGSGRISARSRSRRSTEPQEHECATK
jgi:superfamily I DNA and RNA helicase